MALQLPPQHFRERLGPEAELQRRLSRVEVLAIRRNLAALELEQAHPPEPDFPAGAPRHRVSYDVAERPLRGRPVGRLQHDVHGPRVVAAFPEHAFEHRAQRGMTPVLAVEVVVIAGTTVKQATSAPTSC